MTKSGRIELMSPAGDFTSLQAAIDNGADSVYFGVEQLNMRARASMNFTIDDLPEPDTPVNIVILRFGIRRLTFLRLFSRAP